MFALKVLYCCANQFVY